MVKLACLILAHDHPEMVLDTVRSVQTYMTDRILVCVDDAGWDKFSAFPAELVHGHYHNWKIGPYRNCVFGMSKLFARYPDCDYYCHLDYDCLVVSSNFQKDLQGEAWVLGNFLRTGLHRIPLLEKIVGKGRIDRQCRMLGAALFLRRNYLEALDDIDFFDRFLEETEGFENGFFPKKNCWAFEETLWPTVAVKLGGKLRQLGAYCDVVEGGWYGDHQTYPIRFRPEMTLDEISPAASIVHPVKSWPVRQHYALARASVEAP